jgi:hypothetical protein
MNPLVAAASVIAAGLAVGLLPLDREWDRNCGRICCRRDRKTTRGGRKIRGALLLSLPSWNR